MAKTFAQLSEELEILKAKAEAVRQEEKPGVIAKIREAIRVYELSPSDLFDTAKKTASIEAKAQTRTEAAKKSKATADSKPNAKYGDDSGNTWSGRGPQPNWLKSAIAGGKPLESFRTDVTPGAELVGKRAPVEPPTATAEVPKSKAKKKAKQAGKNSDFVSVPKYAGNGGQTWSGRGPQPNWVKDALAGGKTLEELAI